MITVSTVSPREARVAAGALGSAVPRDMGWEVYLRGTLFSSRAALPAMDDAWLAPPEARDAQG